MHALICKLQADPEILLKYLAAVGALVAFLIGLLQYRRSQLWKRKEFLGKEIKAFLSDATIRNALLMIDWGSRRIPFDPGAERMAWPKVTREIQVCALQPHILRPAKPTVAGDDPQKFTDVEALIRDTYDAFLDGLERLNAFAESGLFKERELTPYLDYWLCEITATTRTLRTLEDMRWRLALLAYIHFYRFVGVQRLFGCLVGDITVGGGIWQSLRSSDVVLAATLEDACRTA